MLRAIAILAVLSLTGCATASPRKASVENVEFFVSFNPDAGYYFQMKADDTFILPEFVNDSDGYTIGRIWENGTSSGKFSSGDILFCSCEGEFFSRNDKKWFRVMKANYFFDKPSRWKAKK